MEKFTKGEWSYDAKSGLIMTDAENLECNIICDMMPTDNMEEETANANLVACAPDMYGLLSSISKEARDYVNRGGKCTTWLREVESLLAKARGEHG